MRERPILFSGAMVRAILEGRKTQTRRVVKRQPPLEAEYCGQGTPPTPDHFWWQEIDGCSNVYVQACPYGQLGDRLWVRETFHREQHPAEVGLTQSDIPHFWAMAVAKAGTYLYRADAGSEVAIDGRRWTPSIHMPRAACRLVLEITGVRVERLQAITEADAIAEGTDPAPGITGDDDLMVHEIMVAHETGAAKPLMPAPVARFVLLWDSINSAFPANWNANPWVWVIEFKLVYP
jgi:hypothetical protein